MQQASRVVVVHSNLSGCKFNVLNLSKSTRNHGCRLSKKKKKIQLLLQSDCPSFVECVEAICVGGLFWREEDKPVLVIYF